MNTTIKRIAFVLITLIVNILLDQWTKGIAIEKLMGEPSTYYMNDLFVLTFVENDGAFLSLGSDLNPTLQLVLLKALPVLMLSLLTFYTFFSKELNRYQILALSFILGGGISNIYDRLLFGKVVDFMNMGIGSLRTGIFNFADVSIMVGIGIFLFSNLLMKKKKEEEIEAPLREGS
ncbi:MAG: signal peptidase II [Saprospiraceae bacterium]|jgi:signal peptidase II